MTKVMSVVDTPNVESEERETKKRIRNEPYHYANGVPITIVMMDYMPGHYDKGCESFRTILFAGYLPEDVYDGLCADFADLESLPLQLQFTVFTCRYPKKLPCLPKQLAIWSVRNDKAPESIEDAKHTTVVADENNPSDKRDAELMALLHAKRELESFIYLGWEDDHFIENDIEDDPALKSELEKHIRKFDGDSLPDFLTSGTLDDEEVSNFLKLAKKNSVFIDKEAMAAGFFDMSAISKLRENPYCQRMSEETYNDLYKALNDIRVAKDLPLLDDSVDNTLENDQEEILEDEEDDFEENNHNNNDIEEDVENYRDYVVNSSKKKKTANMQDSEDDHSYSPRSPAYSPTDPDYMPEEDNSDFKLLNPKRQDSKEF